MLALLNSVAYGLVVMLSALRCFGSEQHHAWRMALNAETVEHLVSLFVAHTDLRLSNLYSELWPMAYRDVPMAYGLVHRSLACHACMVLRSMAHGLHHGPWPMAYGLHSGLWTIAWSMGYSLD